MSDQFKDKVVFITGAAKRIGKEIALVFKELGWNIIIHYNSSKEEADNLANQINKDKLNIFVEQMTDEEKPKDPA